MNIYELHREINNKIDVKVDEYRDLAKDLSKEIGWINRKENKDDYITKIMPILECLLPLKVLVLQLHPDMRDPLELYEEAVKAIRTTFTDNFVEYVRSNRKD